MEEYNNEKSVVFDVGKLAKMVPLLNFINSLITRPMEVTVMVKLQSDTYNIVEYFIYVRVLSE